MTLPEGEAELVERAPESLEEQRSTSGVVSYQAGTTLSVCEPQDRDLVVHFIVGTRDEQLQDSRNAVLAHDVGDEGLRAALV
jgi:hypothetical protein